MPTTKDYNKINDTLDNLVELIQAKRRSQGLSLRAAAEQIGMPWTSLYNIECGVSPRLSNAQLIILWLAS